MSKNPRFKLGDSPIVSLSFCMPETDVPVHPKVYEVNAVFRKQLDTLANEIDEDESMFDDK